MTQEKTLEELQADLEIKAEALVHWCNNSTPFCAVDEVTAVEAALERLYRLRKGQGVRPPEPAAQPDIADLIAGSLQVSRGTAYELMREALKEVRPAPVQEPVAWANPHDLKNFDMKVRTNGGPLHTVALCLCTPPAAQPTAHDVKELFGYEIWNRFYRSKEELLEEMVRPNGFDQEWIEANIREVYAHGTPAIAKREAKANHSTPAAPEKGDTP